MIETRPSDETLVNRASAAFAAFQDGDRAAFDRLVEMTTPLLWHTVRCQGVNQVIAEDVLQAVWLSLLHHTEAVRDSRSIVKWLLTAARREAWRVAGKAKMDGARVSARSVDDEMADVPAPSESLPEAVVLRDRRQQQLWVHVQRLPERCRQLLRVIAFADRPDYALIADALGMPVGSIGPTRGRCLAKLRDQLDRDPHWEGAREA